MSDPEVRGKSRDTKRGTRATPASSARTEPQLDSDVILAAQRAAIQSFRAQLLQEARARFAPSPPQSPVSSTGASSETSFTLNDIEVWLGSVSLPTCCATRGVVIETTHLSSVFGDVSPSCGTIPAKTRRVGRPPDLPTNASWNTVGKAESRAAAAATGIRSVGVNTDAPVAGIDDSAGVWPPRPAGRHPESRPPPRSAPTTPTERDDDDVDALRRRVATLNAENTELDRRADRLRQELAAVRRSVAHPGSAPAGAASHALTLPAPPLQAGDRNRSHQRLHGNAKARTQQLIRELRSKLAVIRTGVKALSASDLFHNAATLLHPFLQNHQAVARRTTERAEFFERSAQNIQAKLLALPDDDSPDGYDVQRGGGSDGRSSALCLDSKTWSEFTAAFTSTVDAKLAKIDSFSHRGARAIVRTATAERDLRNTVNDLEMRCGALESIAVDWECLAVAIASESVFEAVAVQPTKKLEFAALQRQLLESNDEVRVVCGVAEWYAKANTRQKACVWREKRADVLSRIEQMLSQELQHFIMNGPQRNSLRRKVLLLRDLNSLLQRLRTDSDPLPSQAAFAASKNSVPAGVALASGGPNPPALAAGTKTWQGPPSSTQTAHRLQVSGERSRSSVGEVADRAPPRAKRSMLGRTPTPSNPRSHQHGDETSAGAGVPTLPAVGGTSPKPTELNVGRDGNNR